MNTARRFTAQPFRRERGARYTGAMSGTLRPGDLAKEVFGEELHYGALMAYCFRRFGPPNVGSDDHKDLCRWRISTPMEGVFLDIKIGGSSHTNLMFGYIVEERIELALGRENRAGRRRWRRNVARWAKRRFRDDATVLAAIEEWDAPLPKGETPEQEMARYDRDRDKQEANRRIMEPVWKARREAFGDEIRWCGPLKDRVDAALRAAIADLKRPVYVRDVPINATGTMDHMKGHRRSVQPFHAAGYCVPTAIWEDKDAFSDLLGIAQAHGEGAVGVRAVVAKLGVAKDLDAAHAVRDKLDDNWRHAGRRWWRGAWVETRDDRPAVIVRVARNAPKDVGTGEAVINGVTVVVERA